MSAVQLIDHVARTSYRVKRIAKRAWCLGVTCRLMRTDANIGGGGFMLLAAFDTQKEVADWIATNPLPLPYYGTTHSTNAHVEKVAASIYHSLGARVFHGAAQNCPMVRAALQKYPPALLPRKPTRKPTRNKETKP